MENEDTQMRTHENKYSKHLLFAYGEKGTKSSSGDAGLVFIWLLFI